MFVEQMIRDQEELNAAGELTVGVAMINGYYRLLDGPSAGRIIIKCHELMDGEEVVRFANGLTWTYVRKFISTRCERVHPSFPAPAHEPDYSQATWYNDGSDTPSHHTW